MPYRLSCPTQHSSANAILFFRCASSVAVVFWLLLFNACSSNSVPGSNPAATTPTTNPTPSLTISGALPPATIGSSYNATISVTGGTPPYTFSEASGQLPTGVLLGDSSGTISGTPTAGGMFSFTVSVSDSTGLYKQKSLQLTVAANSATTAPGSAPSGGSAGSSFSNLQHSGGWSAFGQRAPNFIDCSPSPCNGISFSMAQGIRSPSMGGQASQFSVGGTPAFGDALWNNHLIGPSSSQGLPDTNQTIVPSLQNFTYDVYFFGDNFGLSQALEFDINQFFDNMGFIWGHECRIAGGNEWDVWDNQNSHWKHTGIPCYPNNNSWNHLTIKVQRTSNNDLVYQSITLNGVTSTLNWTFGHGAAAGWYGLTINYQMDGNSQQDSYSIYLDELTLTYQ